MVSDALRQVMLAADGAGELAVQSASQHSGQNSSPESGEEVLTGRAEHPVCGDLIEVDLRVADGLITDLAWRAEGCPATMAVAAAARRALQGHPLVGAGARLRRRVQDLGGLAKTEQHAIALFERALSQVVDR